MKQVFSHYENWEDYKSGMFSVSDIADKDIKVIGAINLLSSPAEFYSVCSRLVKEWSIASGVNLTNKTQNRRAWLGAAACMFKHNTPEYLTRVAWNLLNRNVQDRANEIADKVIFEFENNISNAKTLFD